MEFEIYDKEKYRQELINYYSNILDGRFLNLNPYDLSDEELMDSIPEGVPEGASIWDINNSFCWLYIGESVLDAYNGNNYTYVNFYSDKNRKKVAMSLNYSQLKYPLSVRTDSIIPIYSEEGQMIQSELDDDALNPEAFFTPNRVGDRILYLFYIPGVTKYGKEKNCVDFAYRNVSPKHIRKYICLSQIAYISWLNQYPTATIPCTSEKVMINGEVKTHVHDVVSIRIQEFARNVYMELFADRVKALLKGEKELINGLI